MVHCSAKPLKGQSCKNAALEGSSKCKVHSKSPKVSEFLRNSGTEVSKLKSLGALAPKKVPKKRKAPKEKKAKQTLSRYALEIEKGIKAGYTLPESDVDYYKLEKSGKLSPRKIGVFQALRKLKGVEDVEMDKKGKSVTFRIERDSERYSYNEGKEVENVEKGIMKLMKDDRFSLEVGDYDEDLLAWHGHLVF